MSIKSQKSLNDECSEIVERSYSVRSNSKESLSGDEEEDSLSRELLKKLTPAMLSKLMRCFKKIKEKNAVRDVERRIEEVMRAAAAEEGIEFSVPVPAPPAALCLDEKGFVSALEQIFGHHKYSPHAHQLFQALDMFGSGRVWWRQVVGRLVAAGALTTSSRRERWEPMTQGQVKKLKHCKCTHHEQCCGGCCFNEECIDTYRSCLKDLDVCKDHVCRGEENCVSYRPRRCLGCEPIPLCKLTSNV